MPTENLGGAPTPGQIVVVSGTSGSGKSTTCERFVARADDFWLLYGIDHFMAATFPSRYGHHGPRAEEGVQAVPVDPADPQGSLRWRMGPHGLRAFSTFHAWIAAASREGCNIIVDHLAFLDPPLLQDLVARTAGLPVLFVCLKPPYAVLAERVAGRTMDKKLPAELGADDPMARIVERLTRLRPWFYEATYANDLHDLELDTSALDPDATCAAVEARLRAGPGEAFEALRQRWAGS